MASYSSSPEFRANLRKLSVESYVVTVGFCTNYSSSPSEGADPRSRRVIVTESYCKDVGFNGEFS